MDIFHLRMFQKQLLDQCNFLRFSFDQLDTAVGESNIDRIFYSIQNILNAGANISKMLFGQGGKFADRRKLLRGVLDIPDDSPLRDVTMRNNFEHMDERIYRWWSNSTDHNFVDKFLGPNGCMVAGMEIIGMFRQYDPKTADVIFWDQEFNLKDLADEVKRILPKLSEEAAKPHWEEKPPE